MAALFEEAAEDILACRHLPVEHQRRLPAPCFSAESMTQLTTPTLSTTAQEILAAIG